MIWAIALWFAGLALSAFFSGSEIGFYRITRVRVVLDAMSGDRVARALLWLINRPTIYVANCLIGNNIGDYLTSLAVVMAMSGRGHAAELAVTIAAAPLLFVYGELMSKYLFYHAPNRLLRRTSLFFLLSAVVFLPLTLLVWAFNRAVELALGQSPQRVQMAIARRELRNVFDEGHDVGILHRSQRALAQSLLTLAGQSVTNFSVPLAQMAVVPRSTKRSEALRIARRKRVATLLIADDANPTALVGYVRAIDLYLAATDQIENIQPLTSFTHTDKHIAALVRMETDGISVARVVGPRGETQGILTTQRLTEPLLEEA
jgi:CBS domain containing-hemolysin-like protein